jgi:hypothetical protein
MSLNKEYAVSVRNFIDKEKQPCNITELYFGYFIAHVPSKLELKAVSQVPETPHLKMTESPKKVPQFYRRVLPQSCISFYSKEGKKIFHEALESGHMECYFKLAAQFRTQDEPAFCGLTTLVIALNALEVDPGEVWKGKVQNQF